MMKTPTHNQAVHKTHRIMLTLDAVSYSPDIIDLAVEMAVDLNMELHGQFVEDIDLLRLAGRPFSSEITLATACERVLDPDSMLRTFHAISREIRAHLEKTASIARVHWSFETIRGRRVETVLTRLPDTDLIIVGYKSSRLTGSIGSYPIRTSRPRKKLLLIDLNDQLTDAFQRTVDLVLKLAKKTAIDLTLIKTDPAESTRYFRQPDGVKQPGIATIKALPLAADNLKSQLRQNLQAFDYVFITQSESSPLLQDILHNSTCPVVIVS